MPARVMRSALAIGMTGTGGAIASAVGAVSRLVARATSAAAVFRTVAAAMRTVASLRSTAVGLLAINSIAGLRCAVMLTGRLFQTLLFLQTKRVINESKRALPILFVVLADFVHQQKAEELALQLSNMLDEGGEVEDLARAAIVAVGANTILEVGVSNRLSVSSHHTVFVRIEQQDFLCELGNENG